MLNGIEASSLGMTQNQIYSITGAIQVTIRMVAIFELGCKSLILLSLAHDKELISKKTTAALKDTIYHKEGLTVKFLLEAKGQPEIVWSNDLHDILTVWDNNDIGWNLNIEYCQCTLSNIRDSTS